MGVAGKVAASSIIDLTTAQQAIGFFYTVVKVPVSLAQSDVGLKSRRPPWQALGKKAAYNNFKESYDAYRNTESQW